MYGRTAKVGKQFEREAKEVSGYSLQGRLLKRLSRRPGPVLIESYRKIISVMKYVKDSLIKEWRQLSERQRGGRFRGRRRKRRRGQKDDGEMSMKEKFMKVRRGRSRRAGTGYERRPGKEQKNFIRKVLVKGDGEETLLEEKEG